MSRPKIGLHQNLKIMEEKSNLISGQVTSKNHHSNALLPDEYGVLFSKIFFGRNSTWEHQFYG